MKIPLAFLSIGIAILLALSPPSQAHMEYDEALLEPPLAQDEYEQQALDILHDIIQNQSYLNVPREDGRFFRILTQSMNAKNVVEIGTGNGYSTIWFGLALKKTGGKLTTFEIDHEHAEIARQNFIRAEMADIITLIEGDAHVEIAKLKDPIDLLFIDADKEGYLDYFTRLAPLVRNGGMIISDNITPEMADPKFVEAITKNPAYETIVRGGVSFTVKK